MNTCSLSRRKDTPENIAKAKELYESGMCYEHVAKALGVGSGWTIRRWLDPSFAERFRQDQRDKRFAYPPELFPIERKPTKDDLRARWAEIPPDTRDLTGVICGDPLPGRDALSRRCG